MSKTWANILGKGTRQSYTLDLSPVGELSDSLIEWTAFDGLSFDGVDDYVGSDSVEVDYTNGLSFSCDLFANSLSDDMDIFTHRPETKTGSSSDDITGIYLVRIRQNGQLEFGYYDGSWRYSNPDLNINTNKWYNLKINWDGTTIKWTLNGQIIEETFDYNLTSIDRCFRVGTHASFTNYYSGVIDNIRVWNDNNENSLILHYKMNEGSGSTLTDSAGDNDGTIYGASWLNTLVETSTDNGETWQTPTNGGSIPNLPSDLNNVTLDVRQNLSTSDSTVTPRLEYLKVRVNTIKYTADLVGNGIANTYNGGYLLITDEFSGQGIATSQFEPDLLVITDFNASGVSQTELESMLINIAEHQASGVGNGEIQPLIIIFNEHGANGIADAVHDSRVFYVWEGEHEASGIAEAIVDSNIFYVHYGEHEANGIAIAELDGNIIGRLLFRGKQMSI